MITIGLHHMLFFDFNGDLNGSVYDCRFDFLYYFPAMEYHWGISEDTWVSYVALDYQNGTDDFINVGDNKTLNEGDIIAYTFELGDNFYNFTMESNGGVNYTATDIGMLAPGFEHLTNPPASWPLIMVGNDPVNYFGNLSAAWTSLGYTVHETAEEIGFSGTVKNGSHVDVTWHKITGLMTHYQADFEMDGHAITAESKLSYAVDLSSAGWGVAEDTYARYVANIQNGTENRLNMGGGEDGPEYLVDGDIISISFHDFTTGEEMSYETETRTTSDLDFMFNVKITPPGWELVNYTGEEGPPVFVWIMPRVTTELYGDILSAWIDAGYTALETGSSYGFSTDIEIDGNDYYLSVMWDQDTGILDHYLINGTVNGEYLLLEFTRGTTLLPGEMEYDWTVTTGDSFDYHFSYIDFNGDDKLQFGDGYIYTNETVTFTFTALGTYGDEVGYPWLNVTMTVAQTADEIFIGMSEPGYENNDFGEEQGGGAPLLLYPALPLVNGSWDIFESMFSEAGYTVVYDSNIFSIEKTFEDGAYYNVRWNVTDGHLIYYHGIFIIDFQNGTTSQMEMIIEEGPGSYVPPETTTTTTTTTTAVTSETTGTTTAATNETSSATSDLINFSPGFETLLFVTAMIAAIVAQRKKKR